MGNPGKEGLCSECESDRLERSLCRNWSALNGVITKDEIHETLICLDCGEVIEDETINSLENKKQ